MNISDLEPLIKGLGNIEKSLDSILKHVETIHGLIYLSIVVGGFIIIWLVIFNVMRRFM